MSTSPRRPRAAGARAPGCCPRARGRAAEKREPGGLALFYNPLLHVYISCTSFTYSVCTSSTVAPADALSSVDGPPRYPSRRARLCGVGMMRGVDATYSWKAGSAP